MFSSTHACTQRSGGAFERSTDVGALTEAETACDDLAATHARQQWRALASGQIGADFAYLTEARPQTIVSDAFDQIELIIPVAEISIPG